MNSYKYIPSIDELLQNAALSSYRSELPAEFVLALLRSAVQNVREEIGSGLELQSREQATGLILEALYENAEIMRSGSLKRVINATGVVLHTNLGRAPLCPAGLNAINDLAAGYCNLEYDIAAGARGSRYQHVEALLCRLCGAEAALVVNNNAAAVLLALNTLARGREVVVSRGQLIEIGGAFRIPDVMAASGATLIEVGTTNKTYQSDFARAINPNTALLFSAHTSNYRIVGFTSETSLAELVELGEKQRIPVLHDLGSGVLLDLGQWGLNDEPTVQSSLSSGVDVVSFSGDKLLGGPQAGILLGKKEYIDAFKNNQLTRALRVDKLTIAALEATLMEYEQGKPMENIPVLRMLCAEPAELKEKAARLLNSIEALLQDQCPGAEMSQIPVGDMVGGGAYPTRELDGWAVAMRFPEGCLENISKKLRCSRPAVISRKQDNSLIFSIRTVEEQEIELLANKIAAAVAGSLS